MPLWSLTRLSRSTTTCRVVSEEVVGSGAGGGSGRPSGGSSSSPEGLIHFEGLCPLCAFAQSAHMWGALHVPHLAMLHLVPPRGCSGRPRVLSASPHSVWLPPSCYVPFSLASSVFPLAAKAPGLLQKPSDHRGEVSTSCFASVRLGGHRLV